MTKLNATAAGGFAVLIDVDGAGSHPAAWRASGATPSELLSARWVAQAVTAAERAGFTAVTFEDHPLVATAVDGVTGRIDAVVQASFSAPLSSSIGLIPVVEVAYSEPFHVATQLATVDTASHGRAGWIAAADPSPAIAARFGREPLPADAADEELADVVEVVRRLWDSWDDDAVIRDASTGRFLDRDRLHYADFEGHRFSVKGPSILPRSPQGQPVVFARAGTAAEVDVVLIDAALGGAVRGDAALGDAARSDAARGDAARGDGALGESAGALSGSSLAAVTEAATAARAHHGDGVRIVLQLEVILDWAGVTADERLRALDDHAPWRRPVAARDVGAGHVGTPHGGARQVGARYVGDAPGLATLLAALADVVDGVRILPAVLDADLDEVGRAVLPRLREQGVFSSPRAGDSLRSSFGLEHPANRFAEVTR